MLSMITPLLVLTEGTSRTSLELSESDKDDMDTDGRTDESGLLKAVLGNTVGLLLLATEEKDVATATKTSLVVSVGLAMLARSGLDVSDGQRSAIETLARGLEMLVGTLERSENRKQWECERKFYCKIRAN